jgi:hypothetical protein
MKNKLAIVCAAVFLFLSPLVAENIIQNPGFEELRHWLYGGGAWPQDSSDSHSGKYSGMTNALLDRSDSELIQFSYFTLLSGFNHENSFSFWFKVGKKCEDGICDFSVEISGVKGAIFYFFKNSILPNPKDFDIGGFKFRYLTFDVDDALSWGWVNVSRNFYQDWIARGLSPNDTIGQILLRSYGAKVTIDDSTYLLGEKVNWDDICLDASVGIEENFAQPTSFKIWPEMTSGIVNYQSEKLFSVFDAAGRQLFTRQGKGQLLLPKAGVYFFKQDNSISKVVVTR